MLVAIFMLLGITGYFSYMSYLKNRNPVDVVNKYVGDVIDRREYIFQAPKVNNITELVNADENYKIVPLYFGDGLYYEVYMPATDTILTDYSTYIYNKDSSYAIQIIKGVTNENMVNMFGIKRPIVKNTIAYNKPGRKESQIVGALLVDDIGIVTTCYDNPVAYATIFNGMEISRVRSVDGILPEESSNCQTYALQSQIPMPKDSYPFTISPNIFNEAGAKQYQYDDGQLTMFATMKSMDDAMYDMLCRVDVALFDEGVISTKCVTEGTKYLEINDFTVLVSSSTINKSSCILGRGQEARANIITYYKQYCK